MKSALRSIAAFIGFSALALQFWLEVGLPHGPGVIRSTFNFVSYFTILANTFTVLAMLLPLVAPNAALGRFLSRPSVRTAIAGYMIIVGATYFLFLRHLGTDQGLERRADEILHYATPILFLIDWLAFVPKGQCPVDDDQHVAHHPRCLRPLDDGSRCSNQLVPLPVRRCGEDWPSQGADEHGRLPRRVRRYCADASLDRSGDRILVTSRPTNAPPLPTSTSTEGTK
jgi:hypothetical protein